MPDERAFAAPWEARTFALAVKLRERGDISAREWAEALGAEIAGAGPDAPPGDDYRHWLAALEGLLQRKGMLSPREYRDRIGAWAEAERSTPHGEPVILSRAH